MAAPPPVPGVIKVRHLHQIGLDAQTGYHTYVWYGALAPTQAQLNTFCSTLAANWATSVAPQTSSATTLNEITAIDLGNAATPAGVWSGTHTGTLAGQGLAASTCVLVNQVLGRRYRGGHPRMYVPGGVAASLNNPQQWTTGFQSAFQTAFGTYLANMLTAVNVFGSGAYIASVSYWLKGEWKPKPSGGYVWVPAPRPGGPLVEQVLANTVSLTVGQQRRRIRPG